MIEQIRFPECLRSTDFKTFEGLLKIMCGGLKDDIENITNLRDFSKCPDHMLPILCEYIGCPYFSEATVEVNRLILKNWWYLMRNKGTITAFQIATSLALLANDKYNNSVSVYSRVVELFLDKSTGEIYINILYDGVTQEFTLQQEIWIKKLTSYITPAGFRIIFSPSTFLKNFLEVDINHEVWALKYTYGVAPNSTVGLTTLSDTTIKFDSIYNTLQTNNLLNESGNPICPYIQTESNDPAPFGRYNVRSETCLECEYMEECKAFGVLGIGNQEFSGVGQLKGDTTKDPSFVDRTFNIETVYQNDYQWMVISPEGSVPYELVKKWCYQPLSKPQYIYVYNTTLPNEDPLYQPEFYQGIKLGNISEIEYLNKTTYVITINGENNQYPEFAQGISGQLMQFNIKSRDFR